MDQHFFHYLTILFRIMDEHFGKSFDFLAKAYKFLAGFSTFLL